MSTLQQLLEQLKKPGIDPEDHVQLSTDIKVVESLTYVVSKPPSKSEAKDLKESAGYKRVLAAADRRFKTLKATLIPDCRRIWRGPHAEWLAAAVVLDEAGRS